jgi:hypothetical protein
MQKEVISESFRVQVIDHDSDLIMATKWVDFIKKDNVEYMWSLTPAGDLLIYLKEMHGTLAMAAIRDERFCAYAKGEWLKVEVLVAEKSEALPEPVQSLIEGL